MELMQVEICRFTNVRQFLNRAEGWLLRSEAEHNVLLGITRQLLSGDHEFEEPLYLAAVKSDAEVVGCAFRTPPFKLGLTRLPLSAVPLLVQDVRDVFTTLPAVFGPKEEVTRFAECWTQQFGGGMAIGTRQGIFRLDEATLPASDIPGVLRQAALSDRALVLKWSDGFVRDTGVFVGGSHERARRLIRDGSLYLWEDSEPRSMASVAADTPNGVRVGYVYTPPPFRRQGYATAAVAALSQRLLEGGRRFCCLYADLANLTSKAVYERVGYLLQCEVIDVDFM